MIYRYFVRYDDYGSGRAAIYARANRGGDRRIAVGMSTATAERICRLLNAAEADRG